MEEDLTKQFKEKEQEANSLRNQVDEVKNQLKDEEDAENNPEANNKFINSSTTLNNILSSQRSPEDKSGLGYNCEINKNREVGNSSHPTKRGTNQNSHRKYEAGKVDSRKVI